MPSPIMPPQRVRVPQKYAKVRIDSVGLSTYIENVLRINHVETLGQLGNYTWDDISHFKRKFSGLGTKYRSELEDKLVSWGVELYPTPGPEDEPKEPTQVVQLELPPDTDPIEFTAGTFLRLLHEAGKPLSLVVEKTQNGVSATIGFHKP